MKIIAVANQKGGCGKTTTAINLAACLGKREQRVLLLDLDPQGHASLGFGVCSDNARDLYDVFTREVKLEDLIIPDVFAGVDVVPATGTLAAAEHLPVRSDERDHQLAIHLAGIRHRYDYAVIDCPPSMGLLSLNALMVADLVLIPIEMSLFGLNGIDHMYETIARLGERHGRKIPIRVVPTLVDSRTRLCRQFLHEVGERFADDVSSVMVQFTVRLKEAVRQGEPIVAYDPTSTAAVQYLRLADELMSNLQDPPKTESRHEHEVRITGVKHAFEEARATNQQERRAAESGAAAFRLRGQGRADRRRFQRLDAGPRRDHAHGGRRRGENPDARTGDLSVPLYRRRRMAGRSVQSRAGGEFLGRIQLDPARGGTARGSQRLTPGGASENLHVIPSWWDAARSAMFPVRSRLPRHGQLQPLQWPSITCSPAIMLIRHRIPAGSSSMTDLSAANAAFWPVRPDQLSRKFPAGWPPWKWPTLTARAAIALQGGHVMSWQPTSRGRTGGLAVRLRQVRAGQVHPRRRAGVLALVRPPRD